jgi:iron-sulfur cluster assembly protein
LWAKKIKNMSTTIAASPINLTNGAIEQLNSIMESQNIPADHGLRIGVKGGGCSGFSYVLGFDAKKDNDDEFEVGGLRILMEKAHAIYLLGMEIDWVDGLGNRGFSFNNPNATSTCGCGTSFSA